MSRFWTGQSSSSESGSSSDDSSVSDSSAEKNQGPNKRGWYDLSDSDDSSEEERVAKSAKERTFESLEASIAQIKNAMKIRDFVTIQASYQNLMQTVSSPKTKAIIAANGGIPRFFVKLLCNLQDYITERKKDKASFKKLSPSQGRALNRMGNNMRKENKPYEKLMKEYRENPDAVGDSDSDSDSDSEGSAKVSAKSSSSSSSSSSNSDSDSDDDSDSDKDSGSGSDSDSDSSKSSSSSSSSSDSDSASSKADDDDSEVDWDASSSSSSSDDDSDAPTGGVVLKGRARWLKRTPDTTKDSGKRKKKNVKEDEKVKVADEDEETSPKEDLKEKEEEWTAAVLNKKCMELVSSRGRRGTDTKAVLKKLENLSRLSEKFGPRIEVPILMHVITAQFDTIRTLDDFMETASWKTCMERLNRVADVLEDGDDDAKKYQLCTASAEDDDLMIGNVLAKKKDSKMKDAAGVGELGALEAVAADKQLVNPHTGEVETEDERAERLRVEKEANMTEEELRMIPVAGSLSLFVTRLDEEYFKGLKRISPHSIDYVHHLRHEGSLVDLITKIRQYFIRVDSEAEAAELSLLKLEHLYYCHDNIADQLNIIGKDTDSAQLMTDLCTFVYQHGTDRSKTRAMMCQIYHHALHDRFLEARDLLLMSHLQDNISNVGDVNTMILFNRMMVNLGLAAFRLGKIWDAHQCLSDICSGRVRELLAQGITTGRYAGDKSVEEEKAEKRRQIPYHLHINIDLLEACHLISAMLLEVPNMAAAAGRAGSRKSRIFSRQFRKHMESFNRQVFAGPPEQTRDYIMCASKALKNGDWKKCADFLAGLEVWQLLPGENESQKINEMLVEKVKVEGLRTYLFKYSSHYDSLSLGQLCGMFELSKNEVHSIVSKMMFNGDLLASWENETIVLKKIEPSTLQVLALQFAEKAANLVESNERLLDAKSGRHAFRDDGHWKGDQQRGYSQRRGGGHGSRSQGGRGGRGRGSRSGGRGHKGGNRRPRS
mmetsp:Transcript_12628/g.19117  ORF Transcript_12628/g.19117 Transcript_12628/m.19117 type:complete len:997 (+) Transcript_12628:183-3173(+)